MKRLLIAGLVMVLIAVPFLGASGFSLAKADSGVKEITMMGGGMMGSGMMGGQGMMNMTGMMGGMMQGMGSMMNMTGGMSGMGDMMGQGMGGMPWGGWGWAWGFGFLWTLLSLFALGALIALAAIAAYYILRRATGETVQKATSSENA